VIDALSVSSECDEVVLWTLAACRGVSVLVRPVAECPRSPSNHEVQLRGNRSSEIFVFAIQIFRWTLVNLKTAITSGMQNKWEARKSLRKAIVPFMTMIVRRLAILPSLVSFRQACMNATEAS